jgi:hypothetical protein
MLKTWFDLHRDNPYPRGAEVDNLMAATGLTKDQVKNWFVNKRQRVSAAKPKRRGVWDEPSSKRAKSRRGAARRVEKEEEEEDEDEGVGEEREDGVETL